ncbi:uncharacterized protein LOC132720671 [Ruditapes philippinarum]|uniref:uncharacterized protein LOC132720671 n=1 Tax=Ruditapes philippinarum TaxID=129788 RepID=UPI00295BE21A|nr:uncharacterized protein LOC132720671 [Ruditapes philippinarum]
MDILTLPSTLENHIARLRSEEDLQAGLMIMLQDGQTVVRLFSELMANEGRSVIVGERELLFVRNLNDVNIKKYKTTLEKFKKGLLPIQVKLRGLLMIVQANIESSREKTQNSKRVLNQKRDRFKCVVELVQNAEKTIAGYETAASNYECKADNLEKSSNKHIGRSVAHAGIGVFSAVLAVGVGVALAPFSGGASLVVGGIVAGSSVTGNTIALGINVAEAVKYREKAQRARNNADSARCERSKLRDEMNSLLTEINPLQMIIEEAKLQKKNLEALSMFLNRCDESILVLLQNVQDVDSICEKVFWQTNTLSIAKRADMRYTGKYEHGMTVLTEFKGKWRTLTNAVSILPIADVQRNRDRVFALGLYP